MIDELEQLLRRRREREIDELSAEFEGIWSRETIEEMVGTCKHELAASRSGLNTLPVMAPRFARARLLALAQAEERIEKTQPEVLFVCVRNAGRSQMAAALTHYLSEGHASVRSAGSLPGNEVHPAAVAAMAELGVDVMQEFPKPLTDEFVRAADAVITMGCGDACPVYPGKHHEDWEIPDPAGQPIEAVREIRDEISGRVLGLIAQLHPQETVG